MAILKPGVRTSEFGLALIVSVLGCVLPFMASGSMAEKIIGLSLAALASLGYTAGRSYVKANAQPLSLKK